MRDFNFVIRLIATLIFLLGCNSLYSSLSIRDPDILFAKMREENPDIAADDIDQQCSARLMIESQGSFNAIMADMPFVGFPFQERAMIERYKAWCCFPLMQVLLFSRKAVADSTITPDEIERVRQKTQSCQSDFHLFLRYRDNPDAFRESWRGLLPAEVLIKIVRMQRESGNSNKPLSYSR